VELSPYRPDAGVAAGPTLLWWARLGRGNNRERQISQGRHTIDFLLDAYLNHLFVEVSNRGRGRGGSAPDQVCELESWFHGLVPRILGFMRGVYQHESDDLGWMQAGVQAHQQAAPGMPAEHQWPGFPKRLEQFMEFGHAQLR
jgi:hypothetical protein